MSWQTCLILLAVGLGILVAGFAYDVVLGGLFQTSPAGMSDPIRQHSRIARSIEAAGLLVWSLGLVNAVLMVMRGTDESNRL